MSAIKVDISASADGKEVIIAVDEDGKKITVPFPVEHVGTIVAGLLNASVVAEHRAGTRRPPFASAEGQNKQLYVRASAVALAQTDTPDATGIVFAFGSTNLGIGLPRQALQPFGSALLADSAQGQSH